ncbi:hypothetical protein M0802_008398 [Mischocyttarus mexicanus]|nr:hypothetical protein M0802_008398 [Mischocyttarus mexicanus]
MEEYLQSVAKKESLLNPSFMITPAVEIGENFVGDVYRATIEGTTDGELKRIHLIAKCAPLDSRRESNKILILEDLKYKNYYMRELKHLDYPHARLTLRYIARFHAYSFAIRDKKPQIFKTFQSIKEPIFYVGNPLTIDAESNEYTIALIGLIEKVLENEDEHYRRRYKRFVKNMSKLVLEVVKGSSAEPYAVLNHGDAWTNNILFKYKENGIDNDLEDLRFLDFQVCRYASPALDISYIIFCFTFHEMRVKHYDDLLKDYYDSFSSCLQSFDCDPKVLFPYEKLLEHINIFGKYAACMAIFVLHYHADPSKRTLLLDIDVYKEIIRTNKFYRNVLINTFKEFIDRNII